MPRWQIWTTPVRNESNRQKYDIKINNPTCVQEGNSIHRTQTDNRNCRYVCAVPDSKVHGAKMGPIWGRQAPVGPHVGPMNSALWGMIKILLKSVPTTRSASQQLSLWQISFRQKSNKKSLSQPRLNQFTMKLVSAVDNHSYIFMLGLNLP